FANVRYLVPGIALAFAGAMAMAERREIERRWLEVVVWVLAIQGLLQLHAEMPSGVRHLLAWMDLALGLLALSAALRRQAWRFRWALAGALLLAALLAVPAWVRFRVVDRQRALAR